VAGNLSSVTLLRERRDGAGRVTFIELFFDLVYVLAITQLSHLLLDHLSVRGALQTLLLLLAVWWAWCYTAWATNWLNPERRIVRLMLLTLMLFGLLMAATLPEAFGDRGLWFALAYVAIQVGRNMFVCVAVREDRNLRRNFLLISAWSVASGVLWLAGGVAEGSTRELLWLSAVFIDYLGPASGFAVPGFGHAHTTDWTITGGHLAERFQLFVILALGESILVTGSTFGDLEWTTAVVAAFVVAFIGSVTFWWIYFDRSAPLSGEAIESSDDPGRLGRSAYTYFHLPMIAGIIVAAVGDELSIAHPRGHADTATVLVILGGPALFLCGHALFKLAVFGSLSISRLVAIAVLAILVPFGTSFSPLILAATATAVIVVVAVTDSLLFNRHHATEAAPVLAAED
jgi:low temperature requirement protein LtrA